VTPEAFPTTSWKGGWPRTIRSLPAVFNCENTMLPVASFTSTQASRAKLSRTSPLPEPPPTDAEAKLSPAPVGSPRVPDDVVFLDALPVGGTGKVQKTDLRKQYGGVFASPY
jgi:acyl-CoA synthetase (AMP-forming)/AMP-acid ligase II